MPSTLPKAVFSWSGGKDSALALHRVLSEGKTDIVALLTTVSRPYGRISMHGVRESLLEMQAERCGLLLCKVYLPKGPSMEVYEKQMAAALREMKGKGATQVIFGDIFLADLRRYREEKLAAAGLEAVFPLWKEDTRRLAGEFTGGGFRATVSCINGNILDPSFAGRSYDNEFLGDLPQGVDPCGEYGEFHSFVSQAPFFSSEIEIRTGRKVCRRVPSPRAPDEGEADFRSNHSVAGAAETTEFWYCDILAK